MLTDREVGKTLLVYWTNFVKTGKPTAKLWTKFDSQSMQRLQIYSEGEVSLESLYIWKYNGQIMVGTVQRKSSKTQTIAKVLPK